MALFNRKAKNRSNDETSEPTQKEKVKFSKRPASRCLPEDRAIALLLTLVTRHCL